MKLYDFDKMFDERLGKYISENAGKYSESEWEDIIPKLYKKFGETTLKALGTTPCAYYAAMTDEELIKCLKQHIRQGVPVSEFLCGAIEARDLTDRLVPFLDGTAEEREYAMNLIGADERVLDKYLEILVTCGDVEMKDRCVDYIKEKANVVIDKVIANYDGGVEREYMLEIMSRCVVKKERIFNILTDEFRSDVENLPMHASYLAAYADERALPFLMDKIDEEGISFIEYQELKFAIEALGGEYDKERDFSDDPYYKIIKSHEARATDIFGGADDGEK